MLENLLERHWHHLSVNEVLTLLETEGERGLDIFEVTHRQEKFGPNCLTPPKGTHPVLLFLLQFHQPLVYILLASALVTTFLQEWVDSGVIIGVVLVNALIGYIQESKAVKAIDALARTMGGMATVIRAGQPQRISGERLVPGDLVVLQPGDKVPGDLRLVTTRSLHIDESALTGESIPVTKQVNALPQESVLADRINMAYSSTLVTAGRGLGVVVAIGDATEIGQIKGLIDVADVLETPLSRKISKFSGVLLWIIIGLSGITFLVGWFRGETAFDMFMAAVALAVGAIPEGLPAAMTITLAIGVTRMAHRHAIVRKLPAVETLGSTTVVCSDKTGTLTQNQMTVQEIYVGHELFSLTGLGYVPTGQIQRQGTVIDPVLYPLLLECAKAGMLCNDSRLVQANGSWQVEGDPTEGALLVVGAKVGLSSTLLKQQFPRLDTIPFESQDQFMATLHVQSSASKPVMYVKGAIEHVLAHCDRAVDINGQVVDLNQEMVHCRVHVMAEKGLRVLAFASKEMPLGQSSIVHDDVENLVFLGLQGMMDPPRAEATQAVHSCLRAGIQVKMITGDHQGTAFAIAKQMGLAPFQKTQKAFNGQEIETLSDAELTGGGQRCGSFCPRGPSSKTSVS